MSATIKTSDFPPTAKGKCEMEAHAIELFAKNGSAVTPTIGAWMVTMNIGREFTFRPRPDWLPRGTPKLCFANAFALSISEEGIEKGLAYTEGFVTDASCPLNIHHAWCSDEDGIVYDPTLPEELWDHDTISFFGVAVPDESALCALFEEGGHGCLLERPAGRELAEKHANERTP